MSVQQRIPLQKFVEQELRRQQAAFRREMGAEPLDINTVHVNEWPSAVYVNIFYKTDADLSAADRSGEVTYLRQRLIPAICQEYPECMKPAMDLRADSMEKVQRDYQGNWYHYYK